MEIQNKNFFAKQASLLQTIAPNSPSILGSCFQRGFVLLADVCQQGYRHTSKTLLKYIQKPADVRAKRKKQAKIVIICSIYFEGIKSKIGFTSA